jgi:hypothetical protein
MRRRVMLLAAAVLLVGGGCGGGGGRAAPASDASDAVPATTERQVPSNNTTTTERPPPTSTTTTVPKVGLPDSLPIPDASIITLGPGSSIGSGVSIYGVALAEVRTWLLQELAASGYTVVGDDGALNIAFDGDGTSGTAVLTEGDGVIDLELSLGPPS